MRESQDAGTVNTTGSAAVSLSVRVPSDLRRRLRVYAADMGMSVQECVQEAVTIWLVEREGPVSKEITR
jgi:plasmid stability protein